MIFGGYFFPNEIKLVMYQAPFRVLAKSSIFKYCNVKVIQMDFDINVISRNIIPLVDGHVSFKVEKLLLYLSPENKD